MRVCLQCQRCYDDLEVSCGHKNHPTLSKTRDGDLEMIAGYQLESLLGPIGKSELYRASQTASGRSCLIRILAADEENLEQFLHEAQTAAGFFHPNLATIYEIGHLSSGEIFVVAEDPDGKTLLEFLDEVGAPSLLTAIQIARQTAEALHALHLNGLVHRAVNPVNIVLAADAVYGVMVKLRDLDFAGIGERSIVSDKFLNGRGLYSLKYFAPEQCSGDAASPQTDVYSLGILFYEMLAGVPPFEGSSAAALIDAHRNQLPPEIKIANFELRALLTHTLTESLHKRPTSRQSSANAFARQLRHIEQLQTHISTPPPAGFASLGQINYAGAAVAASAGPPAVRSTEKTVYKASTAPVAVMVKGEALGGRILPKPIAKPASESKLPAPVPELIELEIPAAETERFEAASVPIQPVLEWEQPEDDIPSAEDVQQALSEDRSIEPDEAAAATEPDLEALLPDLVLLTEAAPTPNAPEPEDTPAAPPIEKPSEPLPASLSTEKEPAVEIQEVPVAHPLQYRFPAVFRVMNASQVTVVQSVSTPVPAAETDDLPTIPELLLRRQAAEGIAEAEKEDENVVIEAAHVATSGRSRMRLHRRRMHPRTAAPIAAVPDETSLCATEPVQQERIVAVPPRSRLKVLKKHLRRISTEHAAEMPLPEPPQPIEPVEINPVSLQTEPAPIVMRESEKIAVILPTPTKVEWAQPEDDIPSLDDVMEALAGGSIDEIPVAPPPEPKEVAPAPIHAEPAPAGLKQPVNHIPVVTKIPRVTPIEPVMMVQAEADEVTPLRSRQIRIDTEHPSPTPNFYDYNRFSPRGSYDPGFIPTILGERKKREKMSSQPPPDQILSAYNAPAIVSSRYRSIMISGGFVALVGLFLLFGNNEVVRQYLRNLTPDDSVEAKSVPSTTTLPQPDKTNTGSHAKKAVVKTPDKTVPDDNNSVAVASKPASSKDRTPQPVGTRTAASQNATKVPLIPSTRVIYSDNGEVKSKIVTDSRVSDKNPTNAKGSPARPRVVKAAPR